MDRLGGDCHYDSVYERPLWKWSWVVVMRLLFVTSWNVFYYYDEENESLNEYLELWWWLSFL